MGVFRVEGPHQRTGQAVKKPNHEQLQTKIALTLSVGHPPAQDVSEKLTGNNDLAAMTAAFSASISLRDTPRYPRLLVTDSSP